MLAIKENLDFCIVNNEEIHIAHNHTQYIHLILQKELHPCQILIRRAKLIKMAKKNNIKIIYNSQTLKNIKNIQEYYTEEYVSYYFSFINLAKKLKSLLNTTHFLEAPKQDIIHLMELRDIVAEKTTSKHNISKLSSISREIECYISLIDKINNNLTNDKLRTVSL